MTSIVVEDVLISHGHGESTVSFSIVGDPPVQERAKMRYRGLFHPYIYDPSSGEKAAFGRNMAESMSAMGEVIGAAGTGNGNYYFQERTSVKLITTMLLPRPLNQFVVAKGANKKRVRDDAIGYPERKDVDNMLKFVMDALEGYFYKNDSCITKATIEKRFVADGEAVGMDLSFSGKRSI